MDMSVFISTLKLVRLNSANCKFSTNCRKLLKLVVCKTSSCLNETVPPVNTETLTVDLSHLSELTNDQALDYLTVNV